MAARSCPVLVAFAVIGLGLLASTGCYQEMANQPRYDPLEESDFFDDQQVARHPVPGTVPRGHEPDRWEDYGSHFLTGTVDGRTAATLPAELRDTFSTDLAILERGRERYRIYCSHCHDLLGSGEGYVPLRGYPAPPSYHTERLRQVPLGHFFRVISYGYGRMAAHASQIPPADRWAIAAYIRALQQSQHTSVETLDPGDREELETTGE